VKRRVRHDPTCSISWARSQPPRQPQQKAPAKGGRGLLHREAPHGYAVDWAPVHRQQWPAMVKACLMLFIRCRMGERTLVLQHLRKVADVDPAAAGWAAEEVLGLSRSGPPAGRPRTGPERCGRPRGHAPERGNQRGRAGRGSARDPSSARHRQSKVRTRRSARPWARNSTSWPSRPTRASRSASRCACSIGTQSADASVSARSHTGRARPRGSADRARSGRWWSTHGGDRL
jgi:hypothetical protein